MNPEIERKYLLKKVPTVQYERIALVEQSYFKNQGRWERIRKISWHNGTAQYFHTIKSNQTKQDPLIRQEKNRKITVHEYGELLRNSTRFISKNTHVITVDDLLWEIELFHGGAWLVLAEVELPHEKYSVEIPQFIDDELIMEVTKFERFSNYHLADTIENYQ